MKVFLACLALLTVAACLPENEKVSDLEKRIAVLESQPRVQRYQLVKPPTGFPYLLDTQKGKIWVRSEITDVKGKPTAWVEEDILDSSGEIGTVPSDFIGWHEGKK